MASSFKNPKDTAHAISDVAEIKNSSKLTTTVLLSFLAGAYVAFGALLSEVATAGILASGAPLGLYKFAFGAVFPVGLIIVVIAGSELFTGNVMFMTVGALNRLVTLKGLLKNWALSWIFNFAGALFVAFVLAYMSGIMSDPLISAGAVKIASAKAQLPIHQAFIRGIGCNWLVCLAVWIANASDDIIGKIAGIWFPVMAFVTIGFEHCIANMFFIPLGIFSGAHISWTGMFLNNLIPVTLGNIIGGAVFVACIYWYTYIKV